MQIPIFQINQDPKVIEFLRGTNNGTGQRFYTSGE